MKSDGENDICAEGLKPQLTHMIYCLLVSQEAALGHTPAPPGYPIPVWAGGTMALLGGNFSCSPSIQEYKAYRQYSWPCLWPFIQVMVNWGNGNTNVLRTGWHWHLESGSVIMDLWGPGNRLSPGPIPSSQWAHWVCGPPGGHFPGPCIYNWNRHSWKLVQPPFWVLSM